MKIGLQTRVSIAIAFGALTFSAVLLGSFLYIYNAIFDEVTRFDLAETDRALTEQGRKKALAITQLAAESLANHLYYQQMDVISDFAQSTRRQYGVIYFYVLDPVGEIVHDGTPTIESFGTTIYDAMMRQVIESRNSTTWIADGSIHASSPIMVGSQVLGAVRIGLDLGEVESDKEAIRSLLISAADKGNRNLITSTTIIALVLGFLGVFMCVFMARGITGAIGTLRKATEEIGKGHYEVDVSLRRTDEIGDLAEAIRTMAGDLKKGEEKLRLALIEAEAANRAKSDFLANMSHELRTPLTSIKGSLGLIRSGTAGELSDKVQSLSDIAYKNSDRLVLLVNDILDMEKISSGKVEFDIKPMNIATLLKSAMEANRGYGVEHDVTFVCPDCDDDIPVLGDMDRLMQVMSNLMSNAAKFSGDGEQVELSSMRNGNTVRVAVKDKGCGVPNEFRKHIFEKFTQADTSDTRQKGGTGLGLSISKAIIEQHGGTVGFESEVDVGSTFFFTLPVLK